MKSRIIQTDSTLTCYSNDDTVPHMHDCTFLRPQAAEGKGGVSEG